MRQSNYPIQSLILNRWSPRAMSGEPIKDEELMPLFEAARWAPSSQNSQPWRFIFGKKGTPHWKPLFDLLYPSNQSWAKNAAVLVLMISHKDYNGKTSTTHSFDAGAAWQNLALEGYARGLVIHAMGGFEHQRGKKLCHIPDGFQLEVMIAIGKPGKKENLSLELQKKEAPSMRFPLNKSVMEGIFQ